MKRKNCGIRIDADIIDRLSAMAKRRGMKLPEIIRAILAEALDRAET